ncbi:MAG: hypothetical protein FWG74_00150 [Planctomycetes bacterium]|nr:hypothetical protein [Planctomycetota bacterium]
MPYNHAGEIGDVWKHLALCEILKIEKPLQYHEPTSACSEYVVSVNPKIEYGVLRLLGLDHELFMNSEYRRVLKRNGIDYLCYTGSPGLAMEILSGQARYFFHDMEREALDDVEVFAQRKGLRGCVKTFCGDSISAFKDENYLVDGKDFIFIDPYAPFDKNETGHDFFDVFVKAIAAGSRTLLWYGYENLNDKQRILEKLRSLAKANKAEIFCLDAWLKNMDRHGCGINPGVPGCGLACVYLSGESLAMLQKYLKFMEEAYADATYRGSKVALATGVNKCKG